MAISTYAQLQAAAVSWSNRSDLSALIPDFIRLAEDRINRALRVRQMETAFANTIMDNTVKIPAGTVGVKVLWIDGREDAPLASRPYEDLLRIARHGAATAWAMQGNYLYFNGDGDVSGVLYKGVPTLSNESDTNWLLTAHPSAYLYGTLAELFSYTRNMPQAEHWRLKFEGAIGEINGGDMRDRFAGSLQVRVQ